MGKGDPSESEIKAKMDILLINPRSTYVREVAQKVYPPLNLLYLAAALRAKGVSVSILEANAFKMEDEEIFEAIKRFSPLLMGVGVYSEVLSQVREICQLAKSAASCHVVLGGPHASAVPEEVLSMIPEADFVLKGEAEESLPMLVGALKNQGDFSRVEGLFYREDEFIRRGLPPSGPLEIDALPEPARDLVSGAYERGLYFTIMVRSRPVDTLISSRGCPFSCRFCYNQSRHYRGRDPESVVQELETVRRRGIVNIEIVDDHFTTDRQRAMKIFDLIVQAKMSLSFRIKSRVNVVDEELLRKARQAGAYQVSYGTESGNQRILDAMNKGITVPQIAETIEMTRRCGLDVHTSWIFGYPGETLDTIRDTVDFVVKTKPTTANLAVLRPYPETEVYLQAKEEGTLEGDWRPNAGEMPWIRLPWTKNREDLERLVSKAKRRIYYRPHYLFTYASRSLRNANGTLARYAWQELKRSLSGPSIR